MDKIINYLLLVIIFVFDPLAISLVIAANFAFAQAYPKKEEEIEEVEEKEIEEIEDMDVESEIVSSLDLSEEERLKLFAIYGESGSLDIDEDWEIESETSESFEDETTNIVKTKKDELTEQLSNLENYLNKERIGGINQTLERNLKSEILDLKIKIDNEDDDTTIIY